ncbi:MAG: DUF523 domain-containing protein [Candidatus Portnoybacteria bacterium CG08_land_8_20_14_0_20_40_83]|uniref:DUF523 domain-containing protein n=3 Tax=Candidatus Portnoyibacteriota TaxID=1817913 RepID=A0A2M7YN57_9BACT|nr:MAG: purine-nucleoside phosphorylase [Candidatus Portnoybacteria bacterium CG11_big_fil_rev_8_21_14_0_20_40_15]PIS31186.1 MAG: DUF523 domain-containing protein [Candidatus Portnoybacteria bacterium CG08_land_8_20_14_0_20_40_83]PIY74578.1 MAG: DUF523 domain-containing protein [Candidatus Portnoybacteria bacterium CG_4_10_14_0_8_um_filter_40_50]PJA64406.1 MAG: DUF523 domain-containing protein [Candidatus Portnoybacteria bacterium CG_4_9_14_3_um_filter_40_10]
MKLCSACLLGIRCRYDGKILGTKEEVLELLKKEILIPVCPEQLGGLPTPREAAETTGDGNNVLKGREKVITKNCQDITFNFIRGAEEVLRIVQLLGIREAIMKQKSPSCGCDKIPDGTFSGKIVKGDGVTTALLRKNGIKIISEEELY